MRWYLVRSKPGSEQKACEHLIRQDFHVYSPIMEIESIVNGKTLIGEEPLFKGYIFVQFNPETQSAQKVNNTRGVYGIVRFGESITPVPDGVIKHLQDSDGNRRISKMPKRGQSIRIKISEYNSLDAIYIEPDGDSRSVILFNLLGQNKTAILDNSSISFDQ